MYSSRMRTVRSSSHVCVGSPREQAPPRDQTPPVNRMTNSCKNITLPQTSFSGGNKSFHSVQLYP